MKLFAIYILTIITVTSAAIDSITMKVMQHRVEQAKQSIGTAKNAEYFALELEKSVENLRKLTQEAAESARKDLVEYEKEYLEALTEYRKVWRDDLYELACLYAESFWTVIVTFMFVVSVGIVFYKCWSYLRKKNLRTMELDMNGEFDMGESEL